MQRLSDPRISARIGNSRSTGVPRGRRRRKLHSTRTLSIRRDVNSCVSCPAATTPGDANARDWRPPVIRGIPCIWHRNQSVVADPVACGNRLCQWHLTQTQEPRKMASGDGGIVRARGLAVGRQRQLAPSTNRTLCRHNPDRSGLKQIRHWRIPIPDALRRNAGVHGRASTTS